MKILGTWILGFLGFLSAFQGPPGAEGPSSRKKGPSLPGLLEKFKREESLPPAQRIVTASRIARAKDPGVLDFLLRRVPREESPQVQAVLAGGLGTRAGDPRTLQALPGIWKRLAPPSRFSLVRALPSPLPPKALAFFRRVFSVEEEGGGPFLQAALLRPIARSLGRKEALSFLEDRAYEELRKRIRPFPPLARALATELARIGGREAQKVFVALAASRPRGLDEFFRRKASSFQDPECLAWWIRKGLSSKSRAVKLLSLAGLSGCSAPPALEALRKLLTDLDPLVRREAARALGASGDRKGVRSLEKMLRRGSLVDRLEALDALHSLRKGDPAWEKVLLKLTHSPYPPFRARALDLLADLGDRKVFEKVAKAVKDRDWMVRSAFYSYAAKTRDPRAIPLLLERLASETGRLKQEVEKALQRIAGITFGYDLARWRYWWEKEKDRFRPPPLKKPVARKRRYGNTYYGIPVVSHRVIFILDISGSMAAKVGTGGRTRLDLAKDALVQALTRFTRKTRFNIIFFHTLVKAWEKRLMPATRPNQKKALRFVRSTRPMGATNIYGALELAFRDREADTIYLLSDGSPTAGEKIDPEAIARDVLAWNRLRRIVIHTIALGTPSPLLERLARETGGQYVRR